MCAGEIASYKYRRASSRDEQQISPFNGQTEKCWLIYNTSKLHRGPLHTLLVSIALLPRHPLFLLRTIPQTKLTTFIDDPHDDTPFLSHSLRIHYFLSIVPYPIHASPTPHFLSVYGFLK